MRTPRERLLDIQEAIARIEKYVGRGKAEFEKDELLQSWMIRQMEIIGEAASRLPDELQAKFDRVPWREIVGMRNVLAHGYFDIDTSIVWAALVNDVPRLKQEIERILQESGS